MSDTTAPRTVGRTCYNIAWRAGRIFLIVYLVLLLVMMSFENSLIYFPMKFPEGNWAPRGIPVEDAWFTAADGTKIHGWYAPHEQPRAVVLFCHGNGGQYHAPCRRASAPCTTAWALRVLVFDYRGYGKSEGKPDEPGVLADARAARTWLAQKAGVAENRIVLMGESLGGAVAVDLAADGARALILENTFSSMPDVAAHHYPWAPVRLLMRTRFDSAAKIRSYHGPLVSEPRRSRFDRPARNLPSACSTRPTSRSISCWSKGPTTTIRARRSTTTSCGSFLTGRRKRRP